MMTPWERRRLAKKVEDRFHHTPKFYTPEGQQCSVGEFVHQVRPVPVALKFDVGLTEADRIRLHALGVSA